VLEIGGNPERRRKYHTNTKKQKKGQKAKKQQQPNQPKVKRAPNVNTMSRCAALYRDSLIDPFQDIGACVPIFPSVPSLKRRFFSKGVFHAGTGGFGFVTANVLAFRQGPFLPGSTGNDTGNVRFSGQGYTHANKIDFGDAQCISAANNSPYIDTQFSVDELLARPVSMGIRVRYRGTELDKAGVMLCLETPNHNSCEDFLTEEIRAYDRVQSIPVSREWSGAIFQPVRPLDFDYKGDGKNTQYCLVVCCDGATPGTAFEYEVSWNWELIGSFARGKTPAESDSNSAYKIISTLSQIGSYDYKPVMNGVLSAAQFYNKLASPSRAARRVEL
jgi:hypothetical protein